MKTPIGHTFMYNLIILFIFIVFAFLAGSLSYYKAFKVNNRIIQSIEKYEGYNYLEDASKPDGFLDSSWEEIQAYLRSIGYQVMRAGDSCPATYEGMDLVRLADVEETLNYCIYLDHDAASNTDTQGNIPECTELYQYGVLTYMNIGLPIVDRLDIPLFTKTNRIYKFTTLGTCT